MQRTFLDWKRPCLPTLTDLLIERYRRGRCVDLSNQVFFFPSRLAMRRFLALLADRAMREELTIEAPRVRNVGELPEMLYEQKFPFASTLAQQIAWMTAMRRLRRRDEKRFLSVFPHPPKEDDLLTWLAWNSELMDMYQELARETVDFSDVRALCGRLVQKSGSISKWECERWKYLEAIQKEYHRVLDLHHLWDRQSARLYALRQSNSQRDFRVPFQLNLVGCVDLNQILRKFIERVSNQSEAFVFAPESMADRFDADGCLKQEAWQTLDASLTERLIASLRQVSSPADQAEVAATWIRQRRLEKNRPMDDVTVGIPDASLELFVPQALEMAGVAAPHTSKRNVESMQPWRLLESVTCCLKEMKCKNPGSFAASLVLPFETFAQLVRHADLGQYFLRQTPGLGDWLVELDDYFNRYLPDTIQLSTIVHGNRYSALQVVFQSVANVLERMVSQYEHFGKFLNVTADLLKEIYCGGRTFQMDNESDFQIVRSCSELNITITEKMQIPLAMLKWFPISLTDALEILLSRTGDRPVLASDVGDAVAMYGWLELPLDDAPVTAVVGMNDGVVPETINEHLFLPNQLRKALNVKTNEDRFARDMYILSTLLASREDVLLTFGRISVDNEPLLPSRLLLTGDAKEVAVRGMDYFAAPHENGVRAKNRSIEAPSPFFTPPQAPNNMPPIKYLSVSAFADYLASPYLFYLRHVQRLKTVRDGAMELDSAQFGTFTHQILHKFGLAELSYQEQNIPSGTPEEETKRIQELLDKLVDSEFQRTFVAATQAVITIQKEQIRHRLHAFAEQQADRFCAGWRILCVEQDLTCIMRSQGGQGEPLDFGDGEPMYLRGFIDRIDVLPQQGRWMLWDYKTSDRKKTPEENHFRRNTVAARSTPDPENWKDLQLPLYLHLIASTCQSSSPDAAFLRTLAPSQAQAGYILLPEKASEIGFYPAEWTHAHLQSAWELAEEIARRIRKKEFPVETKNLLYPTECDWLLNR